MKPTLEDLKKELKDKIKNLKSAKEDCLKNGELRLAGIYNERIFNFQSVLDYINGKTTSL